MHGPGLGRIDLASEAAFHIGGAEIRPSRLEIEREGGCQAVEPRVMQVLVVLAGAGGRVVSRDELAERCWQGRIVGEDALNRVIAKLRRLGEGPAGGSFVIETVKKVGYRLVSHDPEPAAAPIAAPLPPVRRPGWRRWWLVPAALVAVLALVLLWTRSRPLTQPVTPVEPVVTAATDFETRGLSAVFGGYP